MSVLPIKFKAHRSQALYESMCDILTELLTEDVKFDVNNKANKAKIFHLFAEKNKITDVNVIKKYYNSAIDNVSLLASTMVLARKVLDHTNYVLEESAELFRSAKEDLAECDDVKSRTLIRKSAIEALNCQTQANKILSTVFIEQQKRSMDSDKNQILSEKYTTSNQSGQIIVNIENMTAEDKTKKIAQTLWKNKGLIENQKKQIPIDIETFEAHVVDEQ